MFDRFSRSWQLVKSSSAILKQEQQLLIFPLISAFSTVLVLAAFAFPVIGFGILDGLSSTRDGAHSIGVYVTAFLFYLVQYFVIFFFNAALVSSVMIRLDGGVPTIGAGLRAAGSKFGAILGYAFIAATVGMILRAIQERVGFVGKMVAGLLGAGWTLATYLVVPVLVSTDLGPAEAVKESTYLLKRTWGESVIGQAGLGLAFFVIYLGMAVGTLLLAYVAAVAHSAMLVVVLAILVVSAWVIATLAHSAMSGIYSAALYRYATNGNRSKGFDVMVLQGAFRPKE